MSAVIDEIERLGALVERGELDADEAAHRVAQCSEGGLDLTSAGDWLRHHRTARAACDALAAEVADRLLAVALPRATGGVR